MVKISVFLLVIVAISSAVRSSKNLCVPPEYSRGVISSIACIQCVMNAITGDLMCNRCKNTPTKKDGSCGNPRTEPIPIANCEEFYEYNGKCVACKPGYYLHLNKCQNSDLQSCSVAGFRQGQQVCYSCRDGLVPSTQLDSNCVSNSEAANKVHLDVGGTGNSPCEVIAPNPSGLPAKPFRCVLCKDNLILKKQIADGQVTFKCEAPTSPENMASKNECSTGCASCDEKKNCLWCNHYKNYYMVDRFKCVKSSHLMAALAVILLSLSFLL